MIIGLDYPGECLRRLRSCIAITNLFRISSYDRSFYLTTHIDLIAIDMRCIDGDSDIDVLAVATLVAGNGFRAHFILQPFPMLLIPGSEKLAGYPIAFIVAVVDGEAIVTKRMYAPRDIQRKIIQRCQ